MSDHLLQTPPTVHTCPACGADSYYIRQADLLYHCDGSENRPCQLQLIRGTATLTATPRDLGIK